MRLIGYIVTVIVFGSMVIGGSSIDTSSPESIIDAFDYREYEHPHLNDFGPPFPWQSVMHSFTDFVQIDIKDLTARELEVLKGRRHIIFQDLNRYYLGFDKDAFELTFSGYKGRILLHSPAGNYPHHLFYPHRWGSFYLDNNPSVTLPPGFVYRVIGSGNYGMAVKDQGGGLWHVSFAKFMYFKSPY